MNFSYKNVSEIANEMEVVIKNIESTFINITTLNEKLAEDGSWIGTSKDYYVSQLKKLSNNFEEINTELKNDIEFLRKTANAYNELDKQIIMGIGNIFG